MAERRMFAKTIVLSDAFLDMPLSTRCLYFSFGMVADDDGFINNPKSILRMCGASKEDMDILIRMLPQVQYARMPHRQNRAPSHTVWLALRSFPPAEHILSTLAPCFLPLSPW